MEHSIRIRTEIPGPISRDWIARKEAVVARAKTLVVPIFVESATGATLTDVDGNTFLDFAGGIGCLAVGHSNAAVSERVHAQVDRFLHTDFTIVPYDSYVELAERLTARAPIGGPVKAAFFNSGAEAVENAVKIARAATGRPAVIAFTNAFHGRTLMAMSLTSKVRPYKAGFGPYAPEVYRVPFPDEYHWRGDDAAEEALEALRLAFRTQVDPSQVACVVIEPVQGEGGFVPAPPAYLRGLRALCDEHGIVLIADEVQTGFGRTGTFFAIEQSGVQPDLICVAKSIAAGLPLSGVLGRAAIMDAPGRLGDRRHVRRQPGRLPGGARRPRRDRRASISAVARARSARPCAGDSARCRPACRRSATSAASAPCSASSSCATPPRESRTPRSRAGPSSSRCSAA